jgi:oligopeptide transport system substrate-binding protein
MVKLEKISMHMVNDPANELSLYENGDLDLISSPIESMIIEDELFYTQSIAGTYSFKLNTKTEPFTNENIRKAFALAINRQEIVDNMKNQEIYPAMAAVHPAIFSENKKGYFQDNDIKKAQEYLQKGLEELGYQGASELPTITLSITTGETDVGIAESIQKMWTENLGVKVTLERSDWNIQNEEIQTFDYEVALIKSLSSYREPVNVLELFSHANASTNGVGWQNEEFENLLMQSKLETDVNKRLELLKKAEEQLVDAMPFIPIYFFTDEVIQSKKVNSVAFPYPGQIQLKWASLE